MAIKVNIDRSKEYDFERLASLIEKEITGVLIEAGGNWIADTKANTPVDTGDLRDSWSLAGPEKRGRKIEMELSNPLEYADHVEFGHRTRDRKSYVPGVHMLKNATNRVDEALPDSLNEAMKRVEGKM